MPSLHACFAQGAVPNSTLAFRTYQVRLRVCMLNTLVYTLSMYYCACARLKKLIQYFAETGIALMRIGGRPAARKRVALRVPLSVISVSMYMSWFIANGWLLMSPVQLVRPTPCQPH